MDRLQKLRGLIWDKGAKIFSPEELEEYLKDTANPDGSHNIYRAAALCLNIILSDPERASQFSRGGVTVTRQDLTASIRRYESMAGDRGIHTVSQKKVY